ncbi:MAG: type I polyketide synthase [Polyangiales bacterium]
MSSHPQSPSATDGRGTEVQTVAREPLAIVGIGCRFPGASGPEALWDLLRTERNAITEVPRARFDIDAVHDPRPRTPGKSATRYGGFLDDVYAFDADYFRISPREAARMDPQQRLMLEVAAEALDDALLSKDELARHVAGVYVGCWASDWEGHEYADRRNTDVYSMAGSGRCLISGRVSFAFDLRGPSLTVDTGCSASLIALHLACQSLWLGESTLALVGGVNLILDPKQTITLSQGGMMALDGQCKAFDARADGFVRSDGSGAVVVMPLSVAEARGARIYAVIRGTGASNDGFSNGLLATPSEIGQELAMRAAYEAAQLTPADVQYVEAHGTGTLAGDPVELRALASVMRDRPRDAPCLVGSIKTNIGHTEGASGIAGLIKAALALHHRTIPRSLHCETPTPHVPWDEMNVRVATRAQPFAAGVVARAGVSSFGISGTDVHVILEEASRTTDARVEGDDPRDALLVLSATSDAGLREVARGYRDVLAGGADVRDLCHSAAIGRTHLPERLALVGASREALGEALDAFARGDVHPAVVSGRAAPESDGLVFVFSGQGSQWRGMGRRLLAEEPVFREAMVACDAAIQRHAGWSLLDELEHAPEGARPIDVIQPSIFAVQVALAALLRAQGVAPTRVVGHSMGEVAAAHVAGAIDLDDAARIICRRSEVLERLRGQGGMLSVELSFSAASDLVAPYAGVVSVAASNGTETTVLSGDRRALAELAERLRAREIFCREVQVDAAAHSPQLDPQMPALREVLAPVAPRAHAEVPMLSTVTAEPVEAATLDADYWVRNMRQPVRFASAIAALVRAGHTRFVELSPHPILLGPLQQILAHEGRAGTTVCPLRRDEPERATLLRMLGQLHVVGQPIRFAALGDHDARLVPLPRYPFQRDVFDALPGFDVNVDPMTRVGAGVGIDAGALGEPLCSVLHPKTALWQVPLALARSTYLTDHQVQDAVVFPGAGYVDMALQAARRAFGDSPFELEHVALATALVLQPEQDLTLQVAATRDEPGQLTVQFHTATTSELGVAADSTLHARIRARLLDVAPTLPDALDRAEVMARCTPVDRDGHFASARRRGIAYGPAFQGAEALYLGERETLARVRLPAGVAFQPGAFVAHPALLDACLQACASCIFANTPSDLLYLPIDMQGVRSFAREVGTEAFAHATFITPPHGDEVRARLAIYDVEGRPLLEIAALTMRAMHGAEASLDAALYALAWQQDAGATLPEAGALTAQTWLVLGDQLRDVAARVVARLTDRGARCVVVHPAEAADVQAMTARVAEAASDAAYPLAGVVALWALDAVASDDATPETLQEAQALGVIAMTHLVQALSELGVAQPRLWSVTAGAQAVSAGEEIAVAQAPLWALARVLRYEFPEYRIHSLDLSAYVTDVELDGLVTELSRAHTDDHLGLRGEARHVMRLTRAQLVPRATQPRARASQPPFRLAVSEPGTFDGLVLRETARRTPEAGEVEIEVVAAGLNFIDVMKALGIYPGMGDGQVEFGGECAGRITALGAGVTGLTVGQQVLAMADGARGCFARFVVTRAALVRAVPAPLTLSEATTIPAVFLTAHYALNHLGRLAEGERVLIHSATGGVGLAAIQLAKQKGCEIFATAGTPEKRAYLRALGIAHVHDSRSLAFGAEILAATHGEGIDVVLNSLSGQAIPTSLALLRDDGRFLEIGKRDIYEDMQLGLLPFKNGLTFTHIDLARLTRDKPKLMGALLDQLLGDFARGALAPLPVTAFAIAQAPEAFRHMAQAKHIGKVVLTGFDDVLADAVAPRLDAPLARPDATYLLTGGLGGLGLLQAAWLVEQGARHLVLLGRSAPSAQAELAIAALRARGADVQVRACDVADAAQVRAVLAFVATHMPPLRGVLHGAAVLDDGVALQLDAERFARVMAPKMLGAWNLHSATEALALDFFVLFSSAASALGSPGQGNYAAGNEFMDALAHHRRARGQPALVINWGPWRESGIAVGPDRAGRLAARGMGSVSDQEGLSILEKLMRSEVTQSVVLPAADFHKWVAFYPSSTTGLLDTLLHEGGAVGRASGSDHAMRAEILAAPEPERPARIEAYLVEVVRQVLRMPASKPVDLGVPLNRFGVDSLMAVELKNRIKADLGLTIPVSKLLLNTGLAKLARDLLALMDGDADDTAASDAARVAAGPAVEQVLADLGALDDAGADALLAELLDDDLTGAVA